MCLKLTVVLLIYMPGEPGARDIEQGIPVPTEAADLLPFEKPRSFKNVPDDVVRIVNLYLPAVIEIATPGDGRNVEITKIVNNARNMFRGGVRHHDDLWIQHCASSIRELVDFLQVEHFNQAHQSIPPATDERITKAVVFIINAKSYLSSIVHFRDASKVGQLEKLYPEDGFGEKTTAEVVQDEEQYFEMVCIDVVYTLYHIFSTYCVNNQNA